jgi:hypothetical protein
MCGMLPTGADDENRGYGSTFMVHLIAPEQAIERFSRGIGYLAGLDGVTEIMADVFTELGHNQSVEVEELAEIILLALEKFEERNLTKRGMCPECAELGEEGPCEACIFAEMLLSGQLYIALLYAVTFSLEPL